MNDDESEHHAPTGAPRISRPTGGGPRDFQSGNFVWEGCTFMMNVGESEHHARRERQASPGLLAPFPADTHCPMSTPPEPLKLKLVCRINANTKTLALILELALVILRSSASNTTGDGIKNKQTKNAMDQSDA
jgi:hypothetical protein